MDNQVKDGTHLFDQVRRELVQGNLGMALARTLDAADMDHAEANFLPPLMYFTGAGIQRNTETASEYAKKHLLLKAQLLQLWPPASRPQRLLLLLRKLLLQHLPPRPPRRWWTPRLAPKSNQVTFPSRRPRTA